MNDSSGLDDILLAILALAGGDLNHRCEVNDHDERLSAIATGLNMLAEELEVRESARLRLEELHQPQRKTSFEKIIGTSEVMLRIFDRIRALARVDTTVLVTGETGVGKELVARALHDASPRSAAPFISINMAGLADSLLASQLFGHRRGAFTGAIRDQEGFFEAASGGTIFLDEIGDIPQNVQVHLLRVLEQREVIRVGDSRPIPIDVRIVAATNRDLSADVDIGRFRKDLLYRLQVGHIDVPPLRRRTGDIPQLIEAFLAQERSRSGSAVVDVDPLAMRVLMSHSWPGNVRELRSAIELAAVTCPGPRMKCDDLPQHLLATSRPRLAVLSDDERSRIEAAIESCGGNRTRAAVALGIGRATLYRKLATFDPPLQI